MDSETHIQRVAMFPANDGQRLGWSGGQLAMDGLQLCERSFQRGSCGPDWTTLPEGLLLHIGRLLDTYTVSNTRSVCKTWRRAFSLNVQIARLEVAEHRATQARAFMRAYIRAFPSTNELVLDVTFRRTAREKIQAALEDHFSALHDLGLQALQLNLDLNSFNERKIKLPDVSLLSSWNGLTRLILQESGWRSQQLRVDASTVFSALPSLQELSVVCKYSNAVKAKWWRPPSSAERLAARMPTWPPGASSSSSTSSSSAGGRGGSGGGRGAASARGMAAALVATAAPGGRWSGPAGSGSGSCSEGADADAAMQDVGQQPTGLLGQGAQRGGWNLAQLGTYGTGSGSAGLHTHPHPQLHPQQGQQQASLQSSIHSTQMLPLPPSSQAPALHPTARPVLTQHLRCQLTQNQSMAGELSKALRRITPALQPHVSALTFEIVEETYAEPARCATPMELSSLPGLKSLTLLSGAEDALAHSKLDLLGATGLESLVIFDVASGCWCYKKAGHGIPPRLLSAPPPCLRSLTIVGFVVNQCANLHALSSLSCLEELRLEQPDPDCLAAVVGELPLSWLPPALRVLKLHSMVLPPPTLPSLPYGSEGDAGGVAALALPASAAAADGELGVAGGGLGPSSTQLLYGVVRTAPLPALRELYLSKCKLPTLGVLGVCSQLTSLGVINCLSCSGMMPVAAAAPGLRSLALIHTLAAEQELSGPTASSTSNAMAPAMYAAAAPPPPPQPSAPIRMTAACLQDPNAPTCSGSGGCPAAASTAPEGLHVAELPLAPVVWGSDEQVAAVAKCTSVTSLELILPRGTVGFAAVAALASMPQLRELDVALPCGLGEGMMGLARLGRSAGGRLQRLTLWVDGRACVNRTRARQLQAIQRSLQAHMPHTLVEWAGAESRHSSWTGLEARVFCPH